MRILVVEKIPEHPLANATAIEEPAVKLALQNFRSSLQSDDSMFDCQEAGTGPVAAGGDGAARSAGEFLVTFRDAAAGNRGIYFQLIQKLIELLKDAGSPEVMAVFLCLASEKPEGIPKEGLGLKIRLEATGDSNEKAGLRWGLGLAHLQQALLFTSRYLRQKTKQKQELGE
jgi:hypothetical protein